jgi:bifunctional UDP-N-acetylglucosamine pyrophosphorylase/glucosamine-1-phosphate N-acetyltransferase
MAFMAGGVAAVILAAGKSTRMVTDLPKVLHEVCGRPMLAYVLEACRRIGVEKLLVVVGYRKQDVMAAFPDQDDIIWIEQTEQRGTGHAVMMCEQELRNGGWQDVLVLCGDGPLVSDKVLDTVVQKHRAEHASATLATAVLPDPAGYGRILRDAYGNLQGIVEQGDCTPEQTNIKEINPSYYCFRTDHLLEALHSVRPNNVKNEYYLTDALQIMIAQGLKAVAITAVAPEDVISVNSRQQLSLVSKLMQERIQENLMSNGVTIVDPSNTWIDARAQIGQDTVIHPFTYIHGRVRIGRHCSIGPFAYLREGTVLADDVVVGVFTEVKNTVLGHGTRLRHLSYVGDTKAGQHVNIGAGSIVANFDGKQIQNTEIGDNAYIGNGAILVAPLQVPPGAHVGPGSVVSSEDSQANHRGQAQRKAPGKK